MITRKIAVSGGESGRSPRAMDALTGAQVWRGTHIIDETNLCVETEAGDLLMVDDENRYITITKDGVIKREGYFGVGPAFNAVVEPEILAAFPDAVFSEWVQFRAGFSTTDPSIMPNASNRYYTVKVGPDRYFTRFYDFTFGYDRRTNSSQPSPAGWITPMGGLFTFDAATGVYSDLVLLFDPDGVSSANGSAMNLLNLVGDYAYFFYLRSGDSSEQMVKVHTTTGVMEFKPVGGTNVFQLASTTDNFPYLHDLEGVLSYVRKGANTFYRIPDVEALFTRGTTSIFSDDTDFSDTVTAGVVISAFAPTMPDRTPLQGYFTGLGADFKDLFSNSGVKGLSFSTEAIYFSVSDTSARKWTIFQYNKASETVTLFGDGVVFDRLIFEAGEIASYDDMLGRFTISGGFLYGPCDFGYAKVEIATGDLTMLASGGEDDANFTRSMWYFDWPIYTLDASVTSPDTANTLTVHVYDQGSGRRLKTREIVGTQHIPCFTNDTKFLVCESPNATDNFQIAAHLDPIPVTTEMVNADFNFIGTSEDATDFAF